jgi:hypothetical protein
MAPITKDNHLKGKIGLKKTFEISFKITDNQLKACEWWVQKNIEEYPNVKLTCIEDFFLKITKDIEGIYNEVHDGNG